MAGLMPCARSRHMSDDVYEADSHRRMRQQSLRPEMIRSKNPDERACDVRVFLARSARFSIVVLLVRLPWSRVDSPLTTSLSPPY